MKQKLRSEIEEKDKWDLTLIFKNEEEFNKTLNEAKNEIEKISSYKGKLLESSDSLLSCFEFSDYIERKLDKLYMYAHLDLDSDTTNTFAQTRNEKHNCVLGDGLWTMVFYQVLYNQK